MTSISIVVPESLSKQKRELESTLNTILADEEKLVTKRKEIQAALAIIASSVAILSGELVPTAVRKPMSDDAKLRIAEGLRKAREAKAQAAQVVALPLRHPLRQPPTSRWRIPLREARSAPERGEGVVALPLGKVYGTMGALVAFAGALDEDLDSYLARHASGDWGEVDEHDRKANEYAVENGLRVLSAYTQSNGERIWLITEADRSMTTILLPEEY
jgi:hypothetical protein